MSEPEPQRTRVRVEDPTPQPDPARTGCLWVGGILGVVAGVIVTFLAVPSILNFLFPSETIEVGETFEDDKMVIGVASIESVAPTSVVGWRYDITLRVTARSTWKPSLENFVLVLEDGEELDLGWMETEGEAVPQGESLVVLAFPTEVDGDLAPPDALHLEEPPVKFELSPVAP